MSSLLRLSLSLFQEFGALDESDQVMTYRRMEVAAEPWQSRLDSLVSVFISVIMIFAQVLNVVGFVVPVARRSVRRGARKGRVCGVDVA